VAALAVTPRAGGAAASGPLAEAACRRWRVAPAPELPQIVLSGVAGSSSTDVWAVGLNGVIYPSPPVILHWDGTAWTEASQPASSGDLYEVAAISPTDAWAVGWSGPHEPLALHWDGEGWRKVPTPTPSGSYHYLNGVSAVSSTDVWAAGWYTSPEGVGRALTMHWDGTRWSVVRAPDGLLNAVSAASSDDVWAVGYHVGEPFTDQPFLEHWDGARWRVVQPARPPFGDQNILYGVAAVSPNDVWAVGYYGFPDELQPLIQHWDGTAWSLVEPPPMPDQNTLYAVSASSATDVWAVGRRDTGPSDWQPLSLHWDGATWQAVRPPTLGLDAVFHAVTSISATDVWAAGTYTNSGAQDRPALRAGRLSGESSRTSLNPLLEHSRGCSP
jgi:hypothetical protein